MRILVICLVSIFSVIGSPGHGLAQETASKPKTCGDQGTDNRGNWCPIKKGDTWIQGKSSCRKINDMDYEYTSCGGVSSVYTQKDQCCVESDKCPGAEYVAICVN